MKSKRGMAASSKRNNHQKKRNQQRRHGINISIGWRKHQ